MKIVYIINSNISNNPYVGVTDNLEERLKRHNQERVISTKSRRPWIVISHFVFQDNQKAYDFERYLKTGSCRTFMNKQLIYINGLY